VKFNITKGRDVDSQIIFVTSVKTKRPIPLTGFSLIEMTFPNQDGTELKIQEPLTAAVNEVQTLTLSDTSPDEGSFVLSSGIYSTIPILFSDDNLAIQAALRALIPFSALTVAGSFASGVFTINYIGNDGGRNQPQLVVSLNTLKKATVPTTVTPTTNTEGLGQNGITVVSAECAELAVFLNEVQTAALKKGAAEDLVIEVRVGAKDLNIPRQDGLLNITDLNLT